MLSVQSFTFNPFQENTYVIYNDTGDCIIVDPGCYEPYEFNELTSFIETHKLKTQSIINTHCHIDHVLGNCAVKEYFKVPLLINRIEEPFLRAVKTYAPNYGFVKYDECTPDGYLDEPETVVLGISKLEVIFVPGHAPGHIALYSEEDKLLLSGDVLFYNSIGRTDLPGGDHGALIRSIQTKLFQLPEDVKVYSGHGQPTSIGFEKRTNPFCAVD